MGVPNTRALPAEGVEVLPGAGRDGTKVLVGSFLLADSSSIRSTETFTSSIPERDCLDPVIGEVLEVRGMLFSQSSSASVFVSDLLISSSVVFTVVEFDELRSDGGRDSRAEVLVSAWTVWIAGRGGPSERGLEAPAWMLYSSPSSSSSSRPSL